MKAIAHYKIKEIPEEIKGLFEPGAVCFEYISKFIHPEKLDPEVLDKIKDAVCHKIYEIMIAGTFRDLYGAKEILSKLDIQKISIPEEDVAILNEAITRLTENTLMLLGTSKPSGMGEHDLGKARIILKRAGYSDQELRDDESVKKIVNWRHVLMKMKINKIDRIESIYGLLEDGRRCE